MQLVEIGDPHPVFVQNEGARAPFLIICDHAGRRVPSRLGDLGLPAEAFDRHIAWDIGALQLSRRLGEAFGAMLIAQRYSRLVIDCNRDPARPDAIPEVSDGQAIPGNLGVGAAELAARVCEVHTPYHTAIARELDLRLAAGTPTILIFVHSFTPRLDGSDRPWGLGVLHEASSVFSKAVLASLRDRSEWLIGDNEPYAMNAVDYSAPLHAIGRGLDYLELEVRQDLLADPVAFERVVAILTAALPEAAAAIGLEAGRV